MSFPARSTVRDTIDAVEASRVRLPGAESRPIPCACLVFRLSNLSPVPGLFPQVGKAALCALDVPLRVFFQVCIIVTWPRRYEVGVPYQSDFCVIIRVLNIYPLRLSASS